ncbi:hypothetical protein P43SY_002143 [Pythium insidiosum]|uniref:Transmembrane protein n=1 Tax=Pythium insidiosum TaxID=114742 RepID=A0AAD5Q5L7_PYTIN|nr:hypothetical protein P43SY_002143 [Pythium insidiosum]
MSTPPVSGGIRKALQLPSRWFRTLWTCVLLLHAVYGGAHLLSALLYQMLLLQSAHFSPVWENFGINVQRQHQVFTFMALTDWFFALWHGAHAAYMLSSSLRHQRFLFGSYREIRMVLARRASQQAELLARLTRVQRVRLWLRRWFAPFDLDGELFDTAVDVRETLEIVTHLYIVNRLSNNVPLGCVHVVVTVGLVLNCWTTPLIRGVLVSRRSLRRRLVQVLVDAVIAGLFAHGLPFTLFVVYGRRNSEDRWFDPAWVLEIKSLLEHMLTTAWLSAIPSRFAGLLIVVSLETIKSSVEAEVPQQDSKFDRLSTTGHRGRIHPIGTPPQDTEDEQITGNDLGHRLVSAVFFVVGAVALALQGHAYFGVTPIARPPGAVCQLVTQPWLKRIPTCIVLELNCYRMNCTGEIGAFDSAFETIDRARLLGLMISHCPRLEMPPTLLTFQALVLLQVYNTTLRRWDESARVTRRDTPALTMVHLVGVQNLSRIPDGLVTTDSPVLDFEIFGARELSELPPDLHLRWRSRFNYLQIE